MGAVIDVQSLGAVNQLRTARLARAKAPNARLTGVATDAWSLDAENRLSTASPAMEIAAGV
jgi:hypothetical protein